jgi:hypothetical protein
MSQHVDDRFGGASTLEQKDLLVKQLKESDLMSEEEPATSI